MATCEAREATGDREGRRRPGEAMVSSGGVAVKREARARRLREALTSTSSGRAHEVLLPPQEADPAPKPPEAKEE